MLTGFRKAILIQKQKKLLYQPTKDVDHPLKNNIVLMVCCVSGNSLENKDFLSQQPKLKGGKK
jgi:hypothetical protein